MNIEILFLGKTKDSFLAEGIEEYRKRLSHYTTVQLKTIKCKKLQGSDVSIKEKEAELLLANVSVGSFLIALDSQGKEYDSLKFAERVDRWEMQNIRQVSFLIGGPLGLAPSILNEAREKISLSRMTFTHDMVRLLLLEQLYRAYTIKAGEKYHK